MHASIQYNNVREIFPHESLSHRKHRTAGLSASRSKNADDEPTKTKTTYFWQAKVPADATLLFMSQARTTWLTAYSSS